MISLALILFFIVFKDSFAHPYIINAEFDGSENSYQNDILESARENTLELVHVIFRHGNRNPDQISLYPSDPFYDEKYYPEGYGQLTNEGKRTEYKIGVALRNRYSSILGKTWDLKYLEARSTDYNRTKMSLELVLASLYPPKDNQVWSSLYWQPIPYNYVPKSQDKEILAFDACPRYEPMMNEIYNHPEISSYLKRYSNTFNILEKNTDRKIDVIQAFYLYVGFLIKEELGYPLEDWTEAVYPEPLHSVAVDMYYLMTNTTAIRRMISGYFLKKVLADTRAKMEGNINPPVRKMFLYSAHEMNIATILLSLNALKLTDVPHYGAYILFEVHRINGVYGFKLFYQNYEQYNPMALKIPGCGFFCPYDDFYSLIEEVLPTGDEDCFGSLDQTKSIKNE